jgi:rod shape-determining protein MreD
MVLLSRINHGVWSLMPATVAVILALIAIGEWHFPSPFTVPPQFGLIAVVYWALHRPSVLPAFVAFGIGLIQDILGGGPIGLNALIYLLSYRVVSENGELLTERGFIVEWVAFGIVAAIAGAFAWAVMSMLTGAVLEPVIALVRLAMDVALYPILAWFFGIIGRGIGG